MTMRTTFSLLGIALWWSQAGILVSQASTTAAPWQLKEVVNERVSSYTAPLASTTELRFDINVEKWGFIQQDFYLFYFIILPVAGKSPRSQLTNL